MGTGFFDSMAQGLFGGPSGTQQAPQVDPSQMNASLASENNGPDQANQQSAENMMSQTAQGKGPSAAQSMLNAQTAQTQANANALASSGSGSSGQGLARRQAMMTGANATQQLGGQAAAARSAEQLGAQQNLGQLATAGRGQTIGQGQGNAQIQNQFGLGNAQLQAGQNQLNQQGQEFNAQQGSNLAGSLAGAIGGALTSDAGAKDDIQAADLDLSMPSPMSFGGGGGMKPGQGQQPSLANANMGGKTGNAMQPVGGGGWQGPTGPGGGGGGAFGDAELKEPGGPSHVTLREEPFGLLQYNHLNGEMTKVAQEKLSPTERKIALGSHGAGNIKSPNRDRTVVSDLDMGDSDSMGLNWGPPSHEAAPSAAAGPKGMPGQGESQTGEDRTSSGGDRIGHAFTNFGSGLTGKPMGMELGKKPEEKKEQAPGGEGLSPLSSMFSKPASTAGAPKPAGSTEGADIDLGGERHGATRHLGHETGPHVPWLHLGPSTFRDLDMGHDRQAPEEQHYTRQGNETRKFGPTHNYRQQLMQQMDESDEREKQERAGSGTIKGSDIDFGNPKAALARGDSMARGYRVDPAGYEPSNRPSAAPTHPEWIERYRDTPTAQASTDMGPKKNNYAGALRGAHISTPETDFVEADAPKAHNETPWYGGGAVLRETRGRGGHGAQMISAHDLWRMQNGLVPEGASAQQGAPGRDQPATTWEAQQANMASDSEGLAQHALEDTRIDQLLAQQASRGRRQGMSASFSPQATTSYNQHAYDSLAENDPGRTFLGHELDREGRAPAPRGIDEQYEGDSREPKPWEAEEWASTHNSQQPTNDPTSRFIAGAYGIRR